MKRNLRKFLSLLMVFALLCGMVPAAFAISANAVDWSGNNFGSYCVAGLFGSGSDTTHDPVRDSDYDEDGYRAYVCDDCGAIGYVEDDDYYYDDDEYYEIKVDGHTHRYTYLNSIYHEVECLYNRNCEYYYPVEERHDGANCVCMGYSSYDDDLEWEYDAYCPDNPYDNDHDPVYKYTDDGWDFYQCDYCDEWAWVLSGTNIGDDGLVLTTDDNLSAGDTYEEDDNNVWVEVTPKVYDTDGDDITSRYTFEYKWSGDCTQSSTYEDTAYLDTNKLVCEVTCEVTATNKTDSSDVLYGEVSWYATAGAAIEVEATIFNTNTGYYLSEVDDEGNTSIEEQIYDAVDALESRTDEYTLEYVTFEDVDVTGGYLSAKTTRKYYYYSYSSSSYTLDEVVFYPTANYVGKAVFPFTAYYEDDNNSSNDLAYVSGTITFDVKAGGSGLGIVYTALAGEDVTLDEADFVEFWEEVYPNGTLDYVKFGSISTSKGKLYDADEKAISTSTKCYYYPTRNSDVALDGVTFVPKSSTATGAVEISFNAYGSTKRNGSTSSTPVSGTVTILYTAEEVTPIEYLSTGSVITLDADDFIAKYKEVMGAKTATANSLSIQFLEAPTYGSLYLNYNTSSYYNNGTELTDKNILNYTFSGNKNATRSIEDVTYVPGTYSSVGESLTFACYYGSALKFVGTVNFGATEPIAIEYVTAGTTPVTFSAYDFYNNASLASGYLYFGTPSYGTLYRNYANGTGTRVNTYDTFTTSTVSYGSTYSLNTLTYVPAAGYVGVVEIPIYSTYSLLGAQTKGTVKIYVGRSFTDVLGTVSAWAAPYINKLSAQGIVNGTDVGMTKFSPTKTVTYGEALKLIMMAAGYPEQAMTNTHWASGYLTKAYYDGLVSSSAIDLNAEVTRDTIASITAKALGLSYATSVNYGVTAPTDSTNGYVYALYNAGIVNGTYNAAGQNVYNGSNSITRAEISKIICMVADYAAEN